MNNWMYDLQTKPSSYWEDKYTLCDPVSEEDTFCKNQFASDQILFRIIEAGRWNL